MEISFDKIADKLGLTKSAAGDDVTGRREHVGEQARIAGIAGRNKQKFYDRPTGYARNVRRQRNRDTDSARRKERRAAAAASRKADAFYDTAGQLARLYFGLIPARTKVIAQIQERVDRQARNQAAQGNVTFDEALQVIEQNLLANLQESDRRALARAQASLGVRA